MNSLQHEIERASKRFVAYFKPAVLAQYDTEPHKYRVERSDFDGEVSLTSEYWQTLTEAAIKTEDIRIRFGFRKLKSGEYCLAVFAHDFKQYSPGHLERWLPYTINEEELATPFDVRYENWAARTLLGSWEVDNNVLSRIKEHLTNINGVTSEAIGRPLFQSEANPHLRTPISENTHAYEDAHRELYAYLIDGLNKQAVLELKTRAGLPPTRPGYTKDNLQAALPSISPSVLWSALDNVSDQRRKASHKVRPAAKPFNAFEKFIADLEDVEHGLSDLLNELSGQYGIDPEDAVRRQRRIMSHTKIAGPPCGAAHIAWDQLRQAEGRTVQRVDMGVRAHIDGVHESEVLHIHFTDGSLLSLEIHTNACNVSSDHGGFDPSEFHTNFYGEFVPPPMGKP